jgi:ADP-ribose pyrophosphatase YjhB (NUDIX family)
VVRELAEETGLQGCVRRLIGVHSNVYRGTCGDSIHGVRLIYKVSTRTGIARPESGDTTDDACWFEVGRLAALDLSEHARYGLQLLSQVR